MVSVKTTSFSFEVFSFWSRAGHPVGYFLYFLLEVSMHLFLVPFVFFFRFFIEVFLFVLQLFHLILLLKAFIISVSLSPWIFASVQSSMLVSFSSYFFSWHTETLYAISGIRLFESLSMSFVSCPYAWVPSLSLLECFKASNNEYCPGMYSFT